MHFLGHVVVEDYGTFKYWYVTLVSTFTQELVVKWDSERATNGLKYRDENAQTGLVEYGSYLSEKGMKGQEIGLRVVTFEVVVHIMID